MRLAFAVAIHAEPETFLIDEALSVGDAHFQQKCMRRIREFREDGGSIIFVSHDVNAVKLLCDQVLVLYHGKIIKAGNPEESVNLYFQLLAGNSEPVSAGAPPGGGYGSLKAQITRASATGGESSSSTLSSGEEMLLEVVITANEAIPELTLGMGVRDRFGQNLFGTNSHHLGQKLSLAAGETQTLRFRFPMLFNRGKYTISLALHEGPDHTKECYHWWDHACHFEVAAYNQGQFSGMCNLSPQLEVLK